MKASDVFKLEWKISQEQGGLSVKEFLRKENISRTSLKDIKFQGGEILVDGKPVTVTHQLKEYETLTLIFPPEEPSEKLVAENVPLSILYEDPYLLVVNKPPFMDTIPSRERKTGSLANGLVGYYEKIGLNRSPHIVTRLDRNTSGLVLIAKHKHIHHLFTTTGSFPVQKQYAALVEGVLANKKGTIDAPIGRKEGSIIERAVTPLGKKAITHYEVLQQYEEYALVHITTETGRTHQIRVHMAYIGHPLLGDDLYGATLCPIRRHALHCRKISLIHPIHKNPIEMTSEVWEDMVPFLK